MQHCGRQSLILPDVIDSLTSMIVEEIQRNRKEEQRGIENLRGLKFWKIQEKIMQVIGCERRGDLSQECATKTRK